jgi:hypothetical protein
MIEEIERCKPWIEAALEYSGGTHDFIDVAEGIYKGTMQLKSQNTLRKRHSVT